MSEIYLNDEDMEWMGQKKSEYLSLIIQNQRPDDISFADFHLYDQYINDTVTNPDWVSSSRDKKYILRMFCKEHLGVYQVGIGFIVDENVENETFVPILSFVTNDENLALQFKDGEVKKATFH